MNSKYFYITLYLLFFLSAEAFSFLPPQLVTQNLSSLWTVLAAGTAAALAPFVILFFKFKEFLRKNKKTVLLVLAFNVLLALALGIVFYYRIYLPLGS